MVASDDQRAAQQAFVDRFDTLAATDGGPAAAEMFLRTVLGDAAYERMPRAFQDRSKSHWRAIRADSHALATYAPRYESMTTITTPVLLVGGDRSSPYFRPTLDRLLASLPHARLEVVSGGHMLHADAHRRFAELLLGYADDLSVSFVPK
jgi:pimeloyl-ACP methyl ester carboxylesterase